MYRRACEIHFAASRALGVDLLKDSRAAKNNSAPLPRAQILDAGAPPQHVTFGREKAFVASGDDGTVRRHRLDGDFVREVRVPGGSYNVTFGHDRLVTPSLGGGTVSLIDRNGRVRAVRKVARAAHDACIVHA